MSSDPPSKSFPATLIEAAGDKEGVAAAAEEVSVASSAALPPSPPNASVLDLLTHRFSTRVAGGRDDAVDAAIHIMYTGSKSALFGTLAVERWSGSSSGGASDSRL